MLWGDLQTEVLNRLHDPSLSSLVFAWYNDVQADVDGRAQWRNLEQKLIQPTIAPVSTGTVSITNGSSAVVGTGTAFDQTYVGQILRFTDGTYYIISSVTSATQLTLGSVYIGTTNATASYTVYFYQQAAPSDFSAARLYQLTLQDGAGPHYKLRYVTEDVMFDYSPNEAWTTTRPWRFRFYGEQVQFWPPPNKQYNAIWYYSRLPAEIGVNTAATQSLDWPREVQNAILLGVWARGLQFIDDSLYASVKADYEERIMREVEKNNRIPSTDFYMRRWDETAGSTLQPMVYPRNLG